MELPSGLELHRHVLILQIHMETGLELHRHAIPMERIRHAILMDLIRHAMKMEYQKHSTKITDLIRQIRIEAGLEPDYCTAVDGLDMELIPAVRSPRYASKGINRSNLALWLGSSLADQMHLPDDNLLYHVALSLFVRFQKLVE